MENLLLLPNVSVCTVVCKELENRISQEIRNYGSKKLLASFLNSIEITMHPFPQKPSWIFSFAFLFRKLQNPIKTNTWITWCRSRCGDVTTDTLPPWRSNGVSKGKEIEEDTCHWSRRFAHGTYELGSFKRKINGLGISILLPRFTYYFIKRGEGGRSKRETWKWWYLLFKIVNSIVFTVKGWGSERISKKIRGDSWCGMAWRYRPCGVL